MALLLDVLGPDDLFVDVGANVGTYTVLASGACNAKTVSFEPGALARARLVEHVALNGIRDQVEIHSAGASSTSGMIEFIADADTMNRVASGKAPPGQKRTTIEVRTVDEVLAGRIPTAMKIDVEGWELPVLRGAADTLMEPGLLLLIVEMNDAVARYGFSTTDVHAFAARCGFRPYMYVPTQRKLSEGIDISANNVLFIRDLEAIVERVHRAPNRRVNGSSLRL